jgi:TetR/AcrR family transcriptional regulator, regulator of cefoperazone and chloramphenicol sensitivity
MGTLKDSEKTRSKILEAAGRLFAAKGFNGVTVRDIAKEADTHLSALNYHFKTKDALYHEVLLYACKTDSASAKDKESLLRLRPNEALYLIVKESLAEYQKQAVPDWRLVLVARECREPSQEFGEVSKHYLVPESNFLAEIIGQSVGKPSEDHYVRFAVLSLISLIETFGLYTHLIDVVAPGLDDHFKKRNALAKHIVYLVIEAANPSGSE